MAYNCIKSRKLKTCQLAALFGLACIQLNNSKCLKTLLFLNIEKELPMAATVGKITTKELQKIINATVEKKLLELFGDPDQGLELKKSLKNRLLRQKKRVALGHRGENLEEVTKRMKIQGLKIHYIRNRRFGWLRKAVAPQRQHHRPIFCLYCSPLGVLSPPVHHRPF